MTACLVARCAGLRFALKAGVAFNLDNFQELDRTAALIAADPAALDLQQQGASSLPRLIGLRINPQVSCCTCTVAC
jgi:diaminopimelate decarboxylase